MEAVVFKKINELVYQQVDVPMPGIGEVLVKVKFTGICMTDIHIVLGHFPVQPPRILGHEFSGVVEQLGEEVDQSWLGKKVAIYPAEFCGNCAMCKIGRQELCVNFKCLGNTSDGGYAEYVVVKETQLFDLEKFGVDLEQAAWLEPLSCIMLGLGRIHIPENSKGLIIGAGTLGKLFVQILNAVYPTEIAVIDPNRSRINDSIELGAKTGWVIPRQGETEGVDYQINNWAQEGVRYIIDTTGLGISFNRALRWSGLASNILLFGVSKPNDNVNIYPAEIFRKELLITAVAGNTQQSFKEALNLISNNEINTSKLVYKKIRLSEVPEQFEKTIQRNEGKVLIEFKD